MLTDKPLKRCKNCGTILLNGNNTAYCVKCTRIYEMIRNKDIIPQGCWTSIFDNKKCKKYHLGEYGCPKPCPAFKKY